MDNEEEEEEEEEGDEDEDTGPHIRPAALSLVEASESESVAEYPDAVAREITGLTGDDVAEDLVLVGNGGSTGVFIGRLNSVVEVAVVVRPQTGAALAN